MKRVIKKAIAMVVAVLVLGTMVSGDLLSVVKAQGEINITLSTEGSAVTSKAYYRINPGPGGMMGAWTLWSNPTVSIQQSERIEVKIIPDAVCNVDYGNTALKYNGSDVQFGNWGGLIENPGTDIGGVTGGGPELNTENAGDYRLEIKLNSQGGGQGGNNPPSLQNPKNISVDLDAPDGLCQGISIDDRNVDPGTGTVQVEAGATKRKIGICVEFGRAISKITINDININPIPEDVEGWIILNDIDDASTYSIKLEEGESDDISMVWAYDPATYGDDAVVENGRVELLSINRNGDEIPFGDLVNEDGGYIQLKKGDDVKVKLIPDYGYQLKSASVNEQELDAQEDVSTFMLRDLQGNIHFSSIFVKTGDIATSTSTIATNPTILGGGNAANSGNISLSIDDNKDYAKDVTSAVSGNGVEQVASLDLSLDNVVSKGNGDNWVRNITEFENPVSISVNVPESGLAAGETYSIVRDHDGVLTELDASYSRGKLEFETNRFSTYTIVKKTANASSVSTTPTSPKMSPKTSPKTGEAFITYVLMLLLIAGFGAVILFYKKRDKLF